MSRLNDAYLWLVFAATIVALMAFAGAAMFTFHRSDLS